MKEADLAVLEARPLEERINLDLEVVDERVREVLRASAEPLRERRQGVWALFRKLPHLPLFWGLSLGGLLAGAWVAAVSHGNVVLGGVLLGCALFMLRVVVINVRGGLLAHTITAFESAKSKSLAVLALINHALDQEREEIAQRETKAMEELLSLPNRKYSKVRQPTPLWWHVSAPLRLAWFVVAIAALAVPDFFFRPNTGLVGRKVVGRENPWVRELLYGLPYRVVVQPWVKMLVADSISASRRVEPGLHRALARFAQDNDGVEFVNAGLKKRARALVKIRDDYLAPSLPLKSTLFPVLVVRGLSRRSAVSIDRLVRWLGMSCARPVGLVLVLVLVVLLVVPSLALVALLLVGLVVAVVFRAVFHPFVFFLWVGRHTARVVDIARGSLVCDSVADMLVVHEKLMAQELTGGVTPDDDHQDAFVVVRFKNGWAESESGYAQLLYNVRLRSDPNSAVCEVQVTHRGIFKWRRFTHRPYKIVRADNASALIRDLNDQTVGELKDELARANLKLADALDKCKELEELRSEVARLRARLGEEGKDDVKGQEGNSAASNAKEQQEQNEEP